MSLNEKRVFTNQDVENAALEIVRDKFYKPEYQHTVTVDWLKLYCIGPFEAAKKDAILVLNTVGIVVLTSD